MMNQTDEMRTMYFDISWMEIAAHMLQKKIETRKKKLAKLLEVNN